MLHHCDEHIEKNKGRSEDETDKKAEESVPIDDTFQGFAVLGIALLAMGEDVGAEMSLRQFNHLVCHPCSLTPFAKHTQTLSRCTMASLLSGRPSH